MAQFNLFVDVYSGQLVTGQSNPTRAGLPRLAQGDTLSLRIYLLERTQTYPESPAFATVLNTSLSLKVAIGPKNGTAGSTLLTQQYTWSKSADNTYFYADFALNTAAITTALGSSASTSDYWLEIEMSEGGYTSTVFQEQVTIHAEVIDSSSVSAPAGQIALTAQEATGTFLKQRFKSAILYNETTEDEVLMYLGDDGTVHFDPIP
jgi:hypothetical protein